MEVLRVRAGDWLDRPLEEGAMPENQSQPRVHPGHGQLRSCFRASMTMKTVQFEYPKKNIIAGAMAGQAKAHPVPRETGHHYRRGPQVDDVQGKSKSGSWIHLIGKGPPCSCWDGACDALTQCRGWSSGTAYKSESSLCRFPYTFKLLVTTMLVCESKSVKIKDEMQT